MSHLPRAVWRTLSICTLTVGCYLAVLLLETLRGLAPRFQLRWRNRVFRLWGRGLCRFFGARVRLEGRPPEGAFILVSNHTSYVDIPLLATGVHAAFVAKADLQGWPVLGRIFRVADTIFIDRSRKRDLLRVMEHVDAALERGLGVVIFPEGTSGKGDRILRLKPSLLDLAVRRGLPVHYATITYRAPDGHPPTSHCVCWWGDEPFLPHYRRILRLPWFEAVVRFADEPVAATDRKTLAERLHAAMSAQFTPMD